MKKSLLLFITFIFFQTGNSQSIIDSIYFQPEEPTSTDTIYMFAKLYFPTSGCILEDKGYSISENILEAWTLHCLGDATAICESIDTFKLDPLPEGEHTIILSLSTGQGEVPCTPGIIPDDTDTLQIKVLTPSDISELEYSGFSIYPNPATGILYFSEPVQWEAIIYNGTGQSIEKLEKGTTQLDVSDYTPGVFYIKIQSATYKWIKTN